MTEEFKHTAGRGQKIHITPDMKREIEAKYKTLRGIWIQLRSARIQLPSLQHFTRKFWNGICKSEIL
jgi:hypothetical protein